jgi:hypothetical protein
MREGAQYLVYAIKRFGWAEGLWRWFRWHGSPHLIPGRIRDRYRQWKVIDRRKKKSYSRTVYSIDRDGDLYLVECPQCHNTQSLSFYHCKDEDYKPCRQCGIINRYHFHCYHCPIGFSVWMEDGMRKIQDHREGNVPFPAKLVRDDNGVYRLGIDREAPWWWRRSSLWNDLQPNGKDAHGHKPYEIWNIDPEWTKKQMLQESPAGDCERTQ